MKSVKQDKFHNQFKYKSTILLRKRCSSNASGSKRLVLQYFSSFFACVLFHAEISFCFQTSKDSFKSYEYYAEDRRTFECMWYVRIRKLPTDEPLLRVDNKLRVSYLKHLSALVI